MQIILEKLKIDLENRKKTVFYDQYKKYCGII